MKKIIVLLFFVFVSEAVNANTEYATFESFYKESSSVGWASAALGGIAAGVAIAATGGAATPFVAGIGSWIGGMMGYSGAVATNVGLAILGGGSLASGGFGIRGGIILLETALSFSKDITKDYTYNKIISTYNYHNLAQQSEKLLTLPLPVNYSKTSPYKNAIKMLKNFDASSPIYSLKNQQIIRGAIYLIEIDNHNLKLNKELRKTSLLSLLYFISNNYVKAKQQSALALKNAIAANAARTLPAFIYATSNLYQEKFDFISDSYNYFRYAILAEPDNPTIPLLFSIYLDRILLCVDNNTLNENVLKYIFDIMREPALKNIRLKNYTLLLIRYFIRLKLEQQKISFLANYSNEAIKSNPRMLEIMTDSLNKYNRLTIDANLVMKEYLLLDSKERETKAKITEFSQLLIQYTQDEKRLASLINNLR